MSNEERMTVEDQILALWVRDQITQEEMDQIVNMEISLKEA